MAEEIEELAPEKESPEWMPLPDFAPERKEKTFSAEKDGLVEAAQSLTEARQSRKVPKVAEDAPITERGYRWDGGLGKPVEEHYTLDAKRAAEDLSKVRLAEVEAASPAPELTQAIDQVRAAWEQQPQQQPEVQAQTAEEQQQQPQVEQQQQQPQDPANEIRQVLEQHPAVRQAFEHELAQTEQHRAAYAQGLHQSATVAAASLLANFPELAQVPTAHLQSAITAIAATNPQRAAAIDAQLGRTQSIFNQFKAAESAQKQLQMQNMQAWVSAQDAEFVRTVASKESPEVMRKIAENVVALAEEYGVSKKDRGEVWQSQPIMRSAAFQRMMVDAARYRMATSEVAGKLDRAAPPPVQRPGTSQPNNADDSAVAAALNRFKAEPSPKTGADLLRARRAATRG